MLKVTRTERVTIFCDWVENFFGKDYLNSGTGVLDIAGGRGDVAFEMSCKKGITATLIDPKPRSSVEYQLEYVKKNNCSLPSQICLLIEDMVNHPEHKELAENCSLLIGMYADEATEFIVDFALEHSKPFVILPCCFFPEKFPNRKLKSGKLVENVEEFVNYILEKNERNIKANLNFFGLNTFVYNTGNFQK